MVGRTKVRSCSQRTLDDDSDSIHSDRTTHEVVFIMGFESEVVLSYSQKTEALVSRSSCSGASICGEPCR